MNLPWPLSKLSRQLEYVIVGNSPLTGRVVSTRKNRQTFPAGLRSNLLLLFRQANILPGQISRGKNGKCPLCTGVW
jgi:hypothetical protein